LRVSLRTPTDVSILIQPFLLGFAPPTYKNQFLSPKAPSCAIFSPQLLGKMFRSTKS